MPSSLSCRRMWNDNRMSEVLIAAMTVPSAPMIWGWMAIILWCLLVHWNQLELTREDTGGLVGLLLLILVVTCVLLLP